MLRIIDSEAWGTTAATRIPFRYGIAEMTHAPHVVVQVRLEVDGRSGLGWASEHLPPKWFIKDPAQTFEAEARILTRSVLAAAAAATGLTAASPFALWRELDQAQREWAQHEGCSGLVAGLGVALIERALIDAFCRLADLPFADALASGALGFDATAVHPELDGAPFRPARRRQLAVRHTVGLSDPLLDGEVTGDPGDGLPVSVAAAIRRDGVSRFKLKTTGDAEADVERIAQLLSLCTQDGVAARFTIDGNESMHTADHLIGWVDALRSAPALAGLWPRLDAIEQPLHRSVALGAPAQAALAELGHTIPVIIDESDDLVESVREAMDLGYAGGTYKGCKGVFRGVANAALVAARRSPERPTVLTAEDLCTVPPLTVPQDLVVASAIGLEHIERNGHHFFGRFAPLQPGLDVRMAQAHPDLYRNDGGIVRLRITHGRLDLASALRAPFGVTPTIDPGSLPELTEEAVAEFARA